MTQELGNLKNQLKGNPRLYYPDFTEEFNLYTDASAWGLGWFVTQGQDKNEKIITLGFRTLSPREQTFSTIDQESKALELAAKKIKYVTNGIPVNAYTDHKPPTQIPVGIHLLKFNNRNTRTRCEICSKLTIKTLERRHWYRSGVFNVNFEHISYLVLVFLLLTLSKVNARWDIKRGFR